MRKISQKKRIEKEHSSDQSSDSSYSQNEMSNSQNENVKSEDNKRKFINENDSNKKMKFEEESIFQSVIGLRFEKKISGTRRKK